MIDPHNRAVLQFSGGKDSTAMLYKARPWLDRITVVFADSGAIFPHVMDFVHETCRKLGANLKIARAGMSVQDYTAQYGLPADIVPIEADAAWAALLTLKPKTPLQPWTRCCAEMIWRPLEAAIREEKATLVLRGSKRADRRVGVPHGWLEGGIEYRSPLWEWTDSDVFAYLKSEGVTLPKHYETVTDSLDCWLCTAHLPKHGAAKMRFIREHYPDLWPEVQKRGRAVRDAIAYELGQVSEAAAEIA